MMIIAHGHTGERPFTCSIPYLKRENDDRKSLPVEETLVLLQNKRLLFRDWINDVFLLEDDGGLQHWRRGKDWID
jgi:hypothetical protein